MWYLWVAPIVSAFTPIIGIISQPLLHPTIPANMTGSYVFSSYIKWIQAEGADIAILRYDVPEAVEQARKVHGLLFTGGAAPNARGTPYGDFSFRVFKMALHNKIPIWATCQGFEQLLLYTHEALSLQGRSLTASHFDAESLALPLVMTREGERHRWWTDLPAESRHALTQKPIALHYHHLGYAVEDFRKSSAAQEWDMLAVNNDRNGAEFVNIAIMKDYPVWAVQFHPEKNSFEHHGFYIAPDKEVPIRSRDALRAMSDIARDFIDATKARPWGDWDVAEMRAWSIDSWPQFPVGLHRDDRRYPPDSYYLFPPHELIE